MLNDTGISNDYCDTYDYSDWSMEAILSDTTRTEMDVTAPEVPATPCRHCRCPSNFNCQFIDIENQVSVTN